MNIKKIMVIIYIVLLNISIISVGLLRSNIFNDKKIDKQEEMNLSRKTFAIMLEDNEGYVESDNNSLPSNMLLNEELTYCLDINNNKVDNVLSYENKSLVVETSKKIFCYVYFDKYDYLSDYILGNTPSGFNSNIEGGMYRFQGPQTTEDGKTVDNYVCFGTSDKNECINDKINHMYRIIGVTEDKKLKVIKSESLGETLWLNGCDSNFCQTSVSWPNSVPYSKINGSTYLTKENFLPAGWPDLIADNVWKYGTISNPNNTASAIYNAEQSWGSTVTAKIGLMILSDYYYAYQSGGLNCSPNGTGSTCAMAWIHSKYNNSSSVTEWSMVRAANDTSFTSATQAHMIWAAGHASAMNLGRSAVMRPVFYIKSDAKYFDGTGTITNPFIVSL